MRTAAPSRARFGIFTLNLGQTPALLVLLAILLLVELGLRIIEPALPEPRAWPAPELDWKVEQMDRWRAENRRAEVVFVGSSSVVWGLDPEAFGTDELGLISSYNAGVTAAAIPSTALWTEGVVVPRINPSLVVVGLISRDLNENAQDPGLFHEQLIQSKGLRHTATETSFHNPAVAVEKWLDGQFALFRLRPVLQDPAAFAELGRETTDFRFTIDEFGFVSDVDPDDFRYEDSPEQHAAWAARSLTDFSVGGRELAELEDLIEALGSRGIEVVLVSMPVTDDYFGMHPDGPEDFEEFRRAIDSTARDFHISHLDLSDSMPSLASFRDPVHLNPDGARQFTALLAEAMGRSLQELAGHHP